MVFQDKKIGGFINSLFVSLKANALKGWGKDLRKTCRVRGFPTVIILNPQGKEIDRLVGFDGKKEAYAKNLADFSQGKNTLLKMLTDIKGDENNLLLNHKLARKYISRYELNLAIPYFKKVVQLDPNGKKGFKNEARCYLAVHEARANKNVKPLKIFMAQARDQKLLEIGYQTLIRHFSRAKESKAVIATFEDALRKLNKKVPVYMQLGFYYQEIKDYQKAKETFMRCLKQSPGEGSAIYQLGRNAYFAEKDLKEGLEYFKKYLTLKPKSGDPDWADAHWRRGLIYEKMGDKKKAILEYKKALKLKPDHASALKELKRLKK